MHKIAEFLRSRKGRDAVLVFVVCLLGILSFALGRLSVSGELGAPVVLYVPYGATASVPASMAAEREVSPSIAEQESRFVASKNGSVYHLPWCSGAQRINDENKVWYDTKDAAEAAGLRPAANCKGL